MELFKKGPNGTEATLEFKLLQLKSRYKDLFPLGVNEQELKSLWSIFNSTPALGKMAKSNGYVCMSEDILRPLLLRLFVEKGQFTDYRLMNAYSLIEIYLGHNDDITSIEQLESNHIVLYLGFSEFENKRQADIIMQLIEQQLLRRGTLWLIYKGSEDTFANKYRELLQLMNQRKFVGININTRATSGSEEL